MPGTTKISFPFHVSVLPRMLARQTLRTVAASRQFSSSASRLNKVAVLGAGGGIGQPLSLLLKQDKLVTSLSLYDIRGAPGVAADVSHVDTASDVSVKGFEGAPLLIDGLGQGLCPGQAGRGSSGS
jgi:malate dehydrogenase